MTATLRQFFDEPINTPKPAPCEPKKSRPVSRPPKPTTDIKLWLKSNGPRDRAEVNDLRQCLYHRKSYGCYTLEGGFLDRFTVKGRTSSLLIVSDRARHYLLRQICVLVGTDRIRDSYSRKSRHR